MEVLSRGAWLGGMVLEVLGVLWFASIPLLFLAAVAWGAVKGEDAGRFRAGWIALGIEGGTTLAVLILGAACARPDGGPASSWAENAVGVLFLFGILAGVGLVVRSRGSRWLAAGTVAFGSWVMLAASLVATMSINGHWL